VRVATWCGSEDAGGCGNLDFILEVDKDAARHAQLSRPPPRWRFHHTLLLEACGFRVEGLELRVSLLGLGLRVSWFELGVQGLRVWG
jgi:hypothetical protein